MKERKAKSPIDIDDIARRMGATVKGEVWAEAGYFGARQLAAQVEERFRTPAYGGRASDPTMTELRNIRLNPDTLRQLEQLARKISEQGKRVAPLQVAALLLEYAMQRVVGRDVSATHAHDGRPPSFEMLLSELEQERAEQRAIESEHIVAPTRLRATDVDVATGDRRLPRLSSAA